MVFPRAVDGNLRKDQRCPQRRLGQHGSVVEIIRFQMVGRECDSVVFSGKMEESRNQHERRAGDGI